MVLSHERWLPVRRHDLVGFARRSHQVVVLAAVTGLLTGLVVAGFDRLVVDVAVDHILDLSPWVIGVLPAAGLIVAAIARRVGGDVSSATADEYLHAFHDPEYVLGWKAFVARLIAAVATLGSGGPMGLEGPSLYSGATIGSRIQRRFPKSFRGADRRVLLVAGAAAGVAAIFKAPATGAVFALEVPYRDDLARKMLLPALVASATSYLVFVAINGTDSLFTVSSTTGFKLRDLLGAIAVGAVAAAGARAFAWMLRRAKALAASPYRYRITIAAGGVLAGAYALGRMMTGRSLLVASGYHVVSWASEPGRSLWIIAAILALRCLATATTVAGGGVGGLFIPLVVAGALTGSFVGRLVNQFDLDLFILIGIAAFLGAGYRVPLAAVMFVAETTGRPSFVVPGLLAAVAAELLMGRSSVTAYQVGDDEAPEAHDAAPAEAEVPPDG